MKNPELQRLAAERQGGTPWKKWGSYLSERQWGTALCAMLKATDTKYAPWFIVDSNDKKRARLNVISHLLQQIPYEAVKHKKVKLPARETKHEYDDVSELRNRHWIPQLF